MKKVLIIPVNYNSYPQLEHYLESIEKAANAAKDVDVTVKIADNSTKREPYDVTKHKGINASITTLDNMGYFGGAQEVLKEVEDPSAYDYIAISNVDLLMDETFFQKLSEYKLPDDCAWLATQSYSVIDHRDKNPMFSIRPSRLRVEFLRFGFKHPLVHKLRKKASSLKRSITKSAKKSATASSPRPVYAGYGAFVMLTKHFISHIGTPQYPLFLYGEELYLAEEIRKAGLRVIYEPSLVINMVDEHISTENMRQRKKFTHQVKSLDFLLSKYY